MVYVPRLAAFSSGCFYRSLTSSKSPKLVKLILLLADTALQREEFLLTVDFCSKGAPGVRLCSVNAWCVSLGFHRSKIVMTTCLDLRPAAISLEPIVEILKTLEARQKAFWA